jgi:hypothetical protein
MTVKPDIKREVNGEILREPAQVIRFSDGNYETTDVKEIAFIKRHSDFGVNIFEVEEEKHQQASPEEMKIIEASTKRGRPKKVV